MVKQARAGGGVVLIAALLVATAGILLAMGRTPWCTCGVIRLWSSDTWGAENSQQLFDPYTFTHVTHGILLLAAWRALAPSAAIPSRRLLVLLSECLWEVVENTDTVIERYRATTMALGYYGDSVLNSLGDVAACAVGFELAARLPWRVTLGIVIALELALAWWIRDSLALNVLMLLYPLEAVRRWQLGG